MTKVICYPRCCDPETYEDDAFYFEMFSRPREKRHNIGYVGLQLFRELRRAKICPTEVAIDFAIIAMAVVCADKAVLRRNSADGWTREISLHVYIHDVQKWSCEKYKLEKALRFLTGDFWSVNFSQITESLVPRETFPVRDKDCLCLLSGGMDSLVGAIDLHESGRNPLFVSQVVRGDAEHQRLYASLLGEDNLCQWSNSINKPGPSENSTRARSIVFYAFALLASCSIRENEQGRKELFVPENGFISLNVSLDPLRTGTLSTKTTHPVYMRWLQEIWNDVGITMDLILPYRYKTKGEVLQECKNQELMKSLIFGSTSCGKYQRHGLRHCGCCVPCLVRRGAFKKAGLDDVTEKGYCTEKLKNSGSLDVAAAALASVQIERFGIDRFVKSALSFAESDDEYEKYCGVVRRGVMEISELLSEQGVL